MSDYPMSYWFVILLIVGGVAWSIRRIKDGTGIPMLAVIATVTVWYVGDAYYNDYANNYALLFEPDVLQNAWLQVAWFLIIFLAAVPLVHHWYNAKYMGRQSGVYQLARFGINVPVLQRQLDIFFKLCLVAYAVIVLVAAIRLRGDILHFFFPFLGYKAEPWGRERIGSGFDAALSLAFNVQIILTSMFGVLAAISTNPRTRMLSLILCFISWPYFLFDRTRNIILTIVIPAVFSWVFLRLRGGIWKKVVVLAGCYILLNGWMAFIIQNRSEESIATAFKQKGFDLKTESEVHHEGLNMFEELSWINTFMQEGKYEPNWGARYFAELVNPIPRVIWHGKPLIGIDYAIARGQGLRGPNSSGDNANVYATISTGLIGQGVVNFGRFLGPAAAALLMSFWVAILARHDLNVLKLGRLPLYALGLILTFNLGRDITFITLYPFVFLVAGLWWVDHHWPQALGQNRPARNRSSANGLASRPPAQNQPVYPSQNKPGPLPVRRPGTVTRWLPPRGRGISPANSDGAPPSG
jgi:hypothetical protein